VREKGKKIGGGDIDGNLLAGPKTLSNSLVCRVERGALRGGDSVATKKRGDFSVHAEKRRKDMQAEKASSRF